MSINLKEERKVLMLQEVFPLDITQYQFINAPTLNFIVGTAVSPDNSLQETYCNFRGVG